jgi:hypothetical protein
MFPLHVPVTMIAADSSDVVVFSSHIMTASSTDHPKKFKSLSLIVVDIIRLVGFV